MESIWEKTCKGPARPPLYGKAQADVAVIGGGMTGILTALELQERRAAPAAAPAVIQTVAVPAAAAPQTQTTAANLQKDPAEMTWKEYIIHRTGNQI